MNQMMDRRAILHLNWLLLLATLLIVAAGILNLYSASLTHTQDGLSLANHYQKQILWGGVGVLAMFVCMLFDYRRLSGMAVPILILSIFGLLAVFLFGGHGGGAKRWLDLGVMRVQPSEAVKVAIIIVGAKLLARDKEPLGWIEFLKVLCVGLVPVSMVIAQPDLGTGGSILLILCGMILYRGVKKNVLKVCAIVVLISPLIIWKLVMPNLLEYQQERIIGFVNPEKASKKAKYQKEQALIAIGSGQVDGKGYLEGMQSKLSFLPERHTDYAIAVFGEEWGFIGNIALISAYCVFLLSIYASARDAKDRFGSFLCAGVYFYFFWHIAINIGMVLGMLPVVGIPLPFFSYGGSAMLVNFCLVGIVLNVSMRRFVFKPV